ncbi:hypothetical protein BJ508DRAFT_365928 [Ascobolus immersus RN42]|uniref:C2H2-type domain-containing protein n=1 Tax=Ascobolus immersus RN42 TaxID=1160509 RepID=A0A3N4HZ67_ASCIM|nr:hypothetical protein BJ508DRAFT_365928 [Ascobolus immersus RN42]
MDNSNKPVHPTVEGPSEPKPPPNVVQVPPIGYSGHQQFNQAARPAIESANTPTFHIADTSMPNDSSTHSTSAPASATSGQLTQRSSYIPGPKRKERSSPVPGMNDGGKKRPRPGPGPQESLEKQHHEMMEWLEASWKKRDPYLKQRISPLTAFGPHLPRDVLVGLSTLQLLLVQQLFIGFHQRLFYWVKESSPLLDRIIETWLHRPFTAPSVKTTMDRLLLSIIKEKVLPITPEGIFVELDICAHVIWHSDMASRKQAPQMAEHWKSQFEVVKSTCWNKVATGQMVREVEQLQLLYPTTADEMVYRKHVYQLIAEREVLLSPFGSSNPEETARRLVDFFFGGGKFIYPPSVYQQGPQLIAFFPYPSRPVTLTLTFAFGNGQLNASAFLQGIPAPQDRDIPNGKEFKCPRCTKSYGASKSRLDHLKKFHKLGTLDQAIMNECKELDYLYYADRVSKEQGAPRRIIRMQFVETDEGFRQVHLPRDVQHLPSLIIEAFNCWKYAVSARQKTGNEGPETEEGRRLWVGEGVCFGVSLLLESSLLFSGIDFFWNGNHIGRVMAVSIGADLLSLLRTLADGV